MKHIFATVCIISICFLPICNLSCVTNRWPIDRTRIEMIEIKQEYSDDVTSIKLDIPDADVNSAIWPIPKVEEIGNGVVIIRVIRGGAGFLLGDTSGGDVIKVKREIGKKYTIIVRDENGKLHNIKDFNIE